MKIAYDAQIFHEQAYGGVSRYVCEIASRIAQLPYAEVSITAPMHINAYLQHLPPRLVSGFRLPGVRRLPLSVRGAGMLLGDLMLRAIAPDLIHETYYFPYRLGPARARRVLTVHDMIHEKMPSCFAPTDRTPRFKLMAIERADHIICNSHCTRRDLIEVHGTDPDKITVVHLGFGLMTDAPVAGAALPFEREPFLLYVGPRQSYKNFAGLLQAYAASSTLRENYRIVCFGGGSFTDGEMAEMAKLGLGAGRLLQVSGDDQALGALYSSAAAFVYPSFYEGFGIPPLEAISFGCPVICSTGGSIPEVVGDAGAYFDPRDPDNMRSVIEKTLESGSARELLIANGKRRLEQFSWDRCARETASVYRNLI
jgi:glycosyltransferase involved in cell wall biosynthesis